MNQAHKDIVNIASYKFVHIPQDKLPEMRESLRQYTRNLGLKGTILLGKEGINLYMAGREDIIDTFQKHIADYSYFKDLAYKVSHSDSEPFTRMLVKIKNEIVTMGIDDVDPLNLSAPHLPPEKFHEMYKNKEDMIVLDTRNDYEIRLGTFKDAIHFDIDKFRDFPEAVQALKEKAKNKTVVTFCTGGIRCEKAAPHMLEMGFENVYQLDGGILNYFERCGGEFWDGECFVFDKRIALDADLNETGTLQCFACRSPVTLGQQEELQGECPYCGDDNVAKQLAKAS